MQFMIKNFLSKILHPSLRKKIRTLKMLQMSISFYFIKKKKRIFEYNWIYFPYPPIKKNQPW